ncbi:MAG: hypothetical protein HZB67_06070 [Candidatus Aenigmarchaeota archaeon]|nr:hypothetical protein [Candidatus Aenigmarchaeota archaeon]
MKYDFDMFATYPPRRCGIGTYTNNLIEALTGFPEVGKIRVAAISKEELSYKKPVDFIINQYDTLSWDKAASRTIKRAAKSKNPTVAVLQHEYGLDGEHGLGNNYVAVAERLHAEGVIVITYFHTILRKPNEHQKRTLQDLAEYSDGLVVATDSAIKLLSSNRYNINPSKLRHIDHGVRIRDISELDRLDIKTRQFGVDNNFLIFTTLGLLSPDKGIQYSIPAYGEFLKQSVTPEDRKRMCYLIAGEVHPDFVASDGGKRYREYREELREAIASSGVRYNEVEELRQVNLRDFDVVFLNMYLSEHHLKTSYGAANAVIYPTVKLGQGVSGVLADTAGAGRIAIATASDYAKYLIGNGTSISDRRIRVSDRGILIARPKIDYIAKGLDYFTYELPKEARILMEENAREKGHDMRWDNSAWKLIQYISFIDDGRRIIRGRGPEFVRENPSKYAALNAELKGKK